MTVEASTRKTLAVDKVIIIIIHMCVCIHTNYAEITSKSLKLFRLKAEM